jgi:DNA-binding sugar fermentation-stimulating protein
MRARLSRKCNVTPATYLETAEDVKVADAIDGDVQPVKKTRGKKSQATAADNTLITDAVAINSTDTAEIKDETPPESKKRIKSKKSNDVSTNEQDDAHISSSDDSKLQAVKDEATAIIPKTTSINHKTNLSKGQPLVDLGELTVMVVVCRPSQAIKTPYVADLIAKSKDNNRQDFAVEKTEASASASVSATPSKKVSQKDKMNLTKALSSFLRSTVQPEDIQLGHTPALDCAGMIVPGAVVYCTPNDERTKTKFTVQFCEEQREDGGVVTVACHPNLAERAARVLLEGAYLTEELGVYDLDNVLRQQTFGNSRVDFVIRNIENNCITLVEVKNVVGADYIEGAVPAGRSEIGVYSVAPKESDGSDYVRHAIFPHGSKKPDIGVVSDRAIKHVHELTCMHGTTDPQGRAVKSAILFIINRSDCEAFRPCHEADMVFAQMLLRAREKGVNLIAKEVIWINGIGRAGRSIPVNFHTSVLSEALDEDHLKRILLFNENGSGRSPPPSTKKKEIEADIDDDDSDSSVPKKKKKKSVPRPPAVK